MYLEGAQSRPAEEEGGMLLTGWAKTAESKGGMVGWLRSWEKKGGKAGGLKNPPIN